jgi:hypothetical protein
LGGLTLLGYGGLGNSKSHRLLEAKGPAMRGSCWLSNLFPPTFPINAAGARGPPARPAAPAPRPRRRRTGRQLQLGPEVEVSGNNRRGTITSNTCLTYVLPHCMSQPATLTGRRCPVTGHIRGTNTTSTHMYHVVSDMYPHWLCVICQGHSTIINHAGCGVHPVGEQW